MSAAVENDARVLVNADVRTMGDRGTRTDAIAWRDGLIVAVGTEEAVRRHAGPDAPTWDAGGATVLPGFIDAHQHPSIAALYGGKVRLTAPVVRSIASLQETLASAARAVPSGQWLVATDWDEGALDERRAPTRTELDDAVPDHPLFALHYTCHRAVANGRALELAGISRDTPDPTGGIISRGRGGVPDGLLIERGMSRVERLARAAVSAVDVDGFLARLGAHFQEVVAVGLTRVVDAAVPADLAVLYREAQRRGLVTVPTVLMPASTTGYLEPAWDALDGPPTGTRDGLLSVGPMKLILDGAPACALCVDWWQAAGAAMSTWALVVRHRSLDPIRVGVSVRPRFGRSVSSGIELVPPNEVRALVQSASERGFAVACHAEGNVAIQTAVVAYEAAKAAIHRAGPPRIEHVIFADRGLVDRMAGAGAVAVVQPGFLSLPAFTHAPSIPKLRTSPIRWMLDAGVTVAGSSDFPVTPFAPLDGIRAAVRRVTASGDVREPDQVASLDEACAIYTRGAATASGCFEECGSLEAGKRADLVVIDRPLDEGAAIDEARVRSTIVGGEIAFGQPAGR